MIGGVKVLDPKKVPGLVYLMPCGKSPHGVDVSPDGKYIIGSGKLQGVTTVFNFEKIQTAIRNKDFTGDEDGIPVLKYESIKDAEVPVGLGPLHTQFGADGYAYTSLFVDSAIAKWKLGTWEVVDKIPMSYSIGHLCAAEGDTVSPDGKYLVGLNKLSHGRHLSVGPSQPESSQLVDISEEKMKLLYDAFTEPEPHYAQMIKADKLKPIEVYPKEENKHPLAIWDVKDAGVTRNGNKVLVKMVARALDDHAARTSRSTRATRSRSPSRTSSRRPTSCTASGSSTTTSTSSSTRARRRPSRSRPTSRACSPTTARTSARRSTRRCRAT